MGSLTNFLELELLDHVLNNAAYSPAAALLAVAGIVVIVIVEAGR